MFNAVVAVSLPTGVNGLDDALGGVVAGDNVVWVAERSVAYQAVEAAFIRASVSAVPTIVVATTRDEARRSQPSGVELINASPGGRLTQPGPLGDALERRLAADRPTAVVVDGFASLVERWGSEAATAFFARTCPMMLHAGAVTYWRMPSSVGAASIERIRQVTQCMLELRGDQLQVIKAESRSQMVRSSMHRLVVGASSIEVTPNPMGGRLARGLAAVRREFGLTQAQLAGYAGVTASAVSQAESGARGLSLETLVMLSDRLGVSLDRLVSAQPNPGYRLARHDRSRSLGDGVVALADDSSAGLRVFQIELSAGSSGTPPVAHRGVSAISVGRGLVQIDIGDDSPVLRPGDSLLASSAPVRAWRNLSSGAAVLQWTLRD